MSNSLLYHAFSIRGYRYVATRYRAENPAFVRREAVWDRVKRPMRPGKLGMRPPEWHKPVSSIAVSPCPATLQKPDFLREGEVFLKVEVPRESLCCPVCGHAHVHVVERFPRRWRTLPIGARCVWIEMEVPRVECQQCGARRRVAPTFAEPKRRHTRSFERYVMELLQFLTPQDVSWHLGISWDLAYDIEKRRLGKRFTRPKLKKLKRIAIDEIHLGKRHRYITLVLDLDSGAVVFVGEGKGQESLKPFWKRLKSSKAKLRAVATDMGQAYIAAVQKNLPKVRLVFDRFHVVKLFNEKLTELRRQLFRQATDLGKQVLKGIRWLLLMDPKNLNEAKNEQQRLQQALNLNQPLATALLPERRTTSVLEPARPSQGLALPDRLVHPRREERHCHTADVRQNTAYPSQGVAGLVR